MKFISQSINLSKIPVERRRLYLQMLFKITKPTEAVVVFNDGINQNSKGIIFKILPRGIVFKKEGEKEKFILWEKLRKIETLIEIPEEEGFAPY